MEGPGPTWPPGMHSQSHQPRQRLSPNNRLRGQQRALLGTREGTGGGRICSHSPALLSPEGAIAAQEACGLRSGAAGGQTQPVPLCPGVRGRSGSGGGLGLASPDARPPAPSRQDCLRACQEQIEALLESSLRQAQQQSLDPKAAEEEEEEEEEADLACTPTDVRDVSI